MTWFQNSSKKCHRSMFYQDGEKTLCTNTQGLRAFLPRTTEQLTRYEELRLRLHHFAELGAESEESFDFLKKVLDDAEKLLLKSKSNSSQLVHDLLDGDEFNRPSKKRIKLPGRSRGRPKKVHPAYYMALTNPSDQRIASAQNSQVLSGMGSQSQGGPSTIPPAFRNFSLAQKEKSVEEFVQDQWLCLTSDDNIGLGVRSFLDLRSWFHNNEVPPCDVCNEAGVKAELCPNESCTVRIHHYCLQMKFSNRRVERVCPCCQTEWPYVVPKAEAVGRAENENEPSQTGKRSRRSRAVEEEGNENEQPEEPSLRKRVRRNRGAEEGHEPTEPSQAPTEPSIRKNIRRSRVVEEEDDEFGEPSQAPIEPALRKRSTRSSRVVKGEDDIDEPSQSQGPSQPLNGKKSRTSKRIDADGSIPSQATTNSSDSRRSTRSSARLQTAS